MQKQALVTLAPTCITVMIYDLLYYCEKCALEGTLKTWDEV